jgi:YidC/Oxa1 family membrane protein insertase
MMQLYKEHKVNPLGGCLPMLVQIPVFIGLFYVLRTAIELRYAGFLWISDLSEPEGILKDVLPLPLNLLPIFMAITMYFQQKLTPTPTGGDEKQMQVQQTMMRVMPVMMLVMLYNFAAGLALYWSTQNVLMIVQQLLYRRRRARQEAAQAGA